MGLFIKNRERFDADISYLAGRTAPLALRMKENVEPLAAGALGIIATSIKSGLDATWDNEYGTTVFNIRYNGLTNLEAAAEYYGMSVQTVKEVFCTKYYDPNMEVEIEDIVFRARMLLSFDIVGSKVAWNTLLNTHQHTR